MRFVLDAVELVIGYPASAGVEASGPGAIVLSYETGALGISLPTASARSA